MIDNLVGNEEILNIYLYGSRVYGRITDNSDYDYIVVTKDTCELPRELIDNRGNNYNIYKLSEWLEMIRENHIVVLESSFLEEKNIIKETKRVEIRICHVELRKSISSVASNAFVKCKKKLADGPDYNPYIAKKSLWHSLRVLIYGIQCAKYGKIIDYAEANKYYDEIVLNESTDWEYYKGKWQPVYNSLKSEFRKLTEKEWLKYKEA